MPTKDEILAKYNEAPKEVRDVLSSMELSETITEIASRNKISLDAMKKLAECNRNMLLGIINPQDFLKELISVGISQGTATNIVAEINQKIFFPTLKKVHENNPQPKLNESLSGNTQNTQKTVPPKTVLPGQEKNFPQNNHVQNNSDQQTLKTSPNQENEPSKKTVLGATDNKQISSTETKEKSDIPIVKEYAVDPYRESFE